MKPEQQIAKFIRALINTSQAPCDDATQNNIAVAKAWLRSIENGKLLITKSEETPAPVESAPAP